MIKNENTKDKSKVQNEMEHSTSSTIPEYISNLGYQLQKQQDQTGYQVWMAFLANVQEHATHSEVFFRDDKRCYMTWLLFAEILYEIYVNKRTGHKWNMSNKLLHPYLIQTFLRDYKCDHSDTEHFEEGTYSCLHVSHSHFDGICPTCSKQIDAKSSSYHADKAEKRYPYKMKTKGLDVGNFTCTWPVAGHEQWHWCHLNGSCIEGDTFAKTAICYRDCLNMFEILVPFFCRSIPGVPLAKYIIDVGKSMQFNEVSRSIASYIPKSHMCVYQIEFKKQCVVKIKCSGAKCYGNKKKKYQKSKW